MRDSCVLLVFVTCESCVLPLGTGLAGRSSATITRLHAQTSRENELTDSGAEATQESVEGLY